MIRRLALVLVATVVVAVACTDFTVPQAKPLPDVLVTNPSFATDIQPIFTARCATASCHNIATHQVNMTLAPGYAYDNIVERQAIFRPSWKRIRAGKADSSFLVQVLSSDTTKHPEISRMPLGRTPLTDNQIKTIINWVNLGALRN